jgi:hypothetical protein
MRKLMSKQYEHSRAFVNCSILSPDSYWRASCDIWQLDFSQAHTQCMRGAVQGVCAAACARYKVCVLRLHIERRHACSQPLGLCEISSPLNNVTGALGRLRLNGATGATNCVEPTQCMLHAASLMRIAQPGFEVELFRRTAEWLAGIGQPEWGAGNYTMTCMVRAVRPVHCSYKHEPYKVSSTVGAQLPAFTALGCDHG